MEINYKELYNRWEKGERDIALAVEVGKSVTSLYNQWSNLGLMKSVSHSDVEWESYFKEYINNEISAKDVAKELDITISTVYNNFRRFGYQRQKRDDLKIADMIEEHKNGATAKVLALKYKRSPQHIRQLIRKHLHSE